LALYFPRISTKPAKVNTDQPDNPMPPPLPPVIAPPPPPKPANSLRKAVAVLMSLYLGLVVLGFLVSGLDDSCSWFLGFHVLDIPSAILTCLTIPATIIIYGLMGLTPMVPKRVALPLVCLIVLPLLAAIPTTIYCFDRALQVDWFFSWVMVVACLCILRWLQGGWKFRWPLVPEKYLGSRAFSWWNLAAFVLLNLFLVLPAMAVYLGGCADLALNHFTDGFAKLRPRGVILQARKYVRDDGRTIVLIPMSHIAESDFYRSVAQSVSSNSVVLLEGVKDSENLLTNKLSYRRAARTLHLAEQHDAFDLTRGELVWADVDVKEMSTNTIAVLNLAALVHSQGLNARTLALLLQFAPSPELQQQLLDDVLFKRNAHVLQVLRERLPQANDFIIPWGAAHMAGLAREIQKSGFRLAGTRDFVSIRFGGKPNANRADTGWVMQPTRSHP
jgi:hypothetical protein